MAEIEPAGPHGVRKRPKHDDVGADDEKQTPQHRPLAQSGGLVLQLVEARATGDEALYCPPDQTEQPELLARRRVVGQQRLQEVRHGEEARGAGEPADSALAPTPYVVY